MDYTDIQNAIEHESDTNKLARLEYLRQLYLTDSTIDFTEDEIDLVFSSTKRDT